MHEGLSYLIESQICFAVLWIGYRLRFANEKTFEHNRLYLLLLVVVAFILPALSIPIWPYDVSSNTFTVGHPTVWVEIENAGEISFFSWRLLPLYMGLTGSMFLSVLSLYSGIRLWQITHKATTQSYAGVKIHPVTTPGPAFSFFSHIYINHLEVSQEDFPQVIAHEMTHVRFRHSWDILLGTILRICFWWNPFVWLWERSLKEVHEFQADETVLNHGFDSEQYIHLILQQITVIHPEFVSGFCYSLIKKRITMIAQNKRKRSATWSMLLSLPAMGLLMVCFSFTARGDAPLSPSLGDTVTSSLPLVDIQISKDKASLPLILVDGQERDNIRGIDADQIASVSVLKDASATEAYGEKGKNGVIQITTKEALSNPPTIQTPDVAAEFPGGESALMTWMGDNLKYAEEALKLSDAALELIAKMPDFKPAMLDGKNVATTWSLPILFSPNKEK